MKEENENGKSTSVKNKKLYLYVALGCAAVLLAAAIIITSVALANRNHIQVDNSTSSSDNEQGGASGDEPVIDKPEEFSAPLATVSVLNEYGFYYNKTLNNYYVHTGVDFSAEQGSEVFAVASGTIESVYTSDVLVGTQITIDHGNGFITWYGHNSDLYVSVGDHVYKGQTIAAMGSTGISSGSHCDFRIQRNGTMVDPLNYLP